MGVSPRFQESKKIPAVNPPMRPDLHERKLPPEDQVRDVLAGFSDEFGGFASGQQVWITGSRVSSFPAFLLS